MKGTGRSVVGSMKNGPSYVSPPSSDTSDWTLLRLPENGTITVPFGWTSGSPPSPVATGTTASVQVRPPSVDLNIAMRLLRLVSSAWM
jgi:hypothetical protein